MMCFWVAVCCTEALFAAARHIGREQAFAAVFFGASVRNRHIIGLSLYSFLPLYSESL